MSKLSHKIHSELYAAFIGSTGETSLQESLMFSILIQR